MSNRFLKAYDSLYRAYREGTLAKGACSACAVGNIIAHALNAKIYMSMDRVTYLCDDNNRFWVTLFGTSNSGVQRKTYLNSNSQEIIRLSEKLKDLTGYSVDEMAQIEFAFESSASIYPEDYQQYEKPEILISLYTGLTAVLEVMLKLDDIENPDYYRTKLEDLHKELLTYARDQREP